MDRKGRFSRSCVAGLCIAACVMAWGSVEPVFPQDGETVPTLPAANVIQEEAEIIFCPEKHFVVESNTQDCIDPNHWKITLKLFYWILN